MACSQLVNVNVSHWRLGKHLKKNKMRTSLTTRQKLVTMTTQCWLLDKYCSTRSSADFMDNLPEIWVLRAAPLSGSVWSPASEGRLFHQDTMGLAVYHLQTAVQWVWVSTWMQILVRAETEVSEGLAKRVKLWIRLKACSKEGEQISIDAQTTHFSPDEKIKNTDISGGRMSQRNVCRLLNVGD